MKNPPHPDAEQESALINQHAKIEVQPAPGKLTHMTKKQIEKAVKKMKVQGHERTSAVSAPPTIPLLAPRPGETLNTVQGYHFCENELDMKNLKPKKSTRLALKKLAKGLRPKSLRPKSLRPKGLRPKGLRPQGLRPKRSKKAIAKLSGQECLYIPDHDKLIDQIVREMEGIYACYCRLDSCRRALSDEERSFLHD